jgi:hypothetical protein
MTPTRTLRLQRRTANEDHFQVFAGFGWFSVTVNPTKGR